MFSKFLVELLTSPDIHFHENSSGVAPEEEIHHVVDLLTPLLLKAANDPPIFLFSEAGRFHDAVSWLRSLRGVADKILRENWNLHELLSSRRLAVLHRR